jgi:hypothetical protein
MTSVVGQANELQYLTDASAPSFAPFGRAKLGAEALKETRAFTVPTTEVVGYFISPSRL